MTDHAVYVIAEAGVNHNGDRDLAFALVDAAADAKVDAVKFQTFTAEKLASKLAPKAAYQKQTTDAAERQVDMLKKLELPREWHAPLRDHAHRRGIEFLSTAFDLDSLAFLDTLGVPFFKVPSGELTNGPLLWRFARLGKPLILSTGMATLSEVEQALAIVTHALHADDEPGSSQQIWQSWARAEWRERLRHHVTLLHCTSQYPMPLDEVNLSAMDTLAAAFHLNVGYSDHSEGSLISIAAVARGARMIEKHFTLDRTMEGPDHGASLEPDELARMVADVRAVGLAIGNGIKAPQPSEWDTRVASRQSVIAARDIPCGAQLSRHDLTTARAGAGLPPMMLWDLVGATSSRSYAAGDPLEIP